jgi:transcriptional regulator with XRE-family HTH domain
MVAEARRLRAERHLTLEVIAERADMTVNGVGNLLRGARTGALESWWRLARGLGVEFSELAKALGPTDAEPSTGAVTQGRTVQ